MRIRVLSDLHLEFGNLDVTQGDEDIVVLAGDIWSTDKGIWWASTKFIPERTIVLCGNHEFYMEEYFDTINKCREAAKDTGVNFLQNNAIVIDGVKFLGTTLWSNFELYGDRYYCMNNAKKQINDFRLIRWDNGVSYDLFSPGHAYNLHKEAMQFLDDELTDYYGAAVVVTHFTPHRNSVPDRFKGDSLTPYYTSDLNEFIIRHHPNLWIHGHTHDSFDYYVADTRIVCNPRGYNGHEVNPSFDPNLIVEI